MTNKEIQVGEYVRTNNVRGIKKVARINEEATVNRYLFIDGYDHSDTIYGIIRTDQITKHSFNLMDLIEDGDHVNGHLVVGFNEKVDINGYKYKEIEVESDHLINHSFKLEDIKSIVTKEQFKAMEYKVGDENNDY